ncbi:glutamine synthetase/guanido kinase [Annulohypoxylon maeteangense]|uniref:glutamine synthetase/guanido kinase n=1 Tax=Annulohypoxylon maeteangense TaxID=1927788 RepID=UPI0020089564|nr:glutamine synthetase/guanido kinase [Annulohypoxylon maeteangense]KAI0885885.1 glutamine synthetase/guanido kinase [Annulohypoxylon maeteangense]
MASDLRLLNAAIDNTPLIDNHAHPLLKYGAVTNHPLLSIASDAHGAALEDSKFSLPHVRAVKQLARALNCKETWEAVEAAIERKRNESPDAWVKFCLEDIETILIDDGLDRPNLSESYSWHDKFTKSRCKRIVRIETVMADVIAHFLQLGSDIIFKDSFMGHVLDKYTLEIQKALDDPDVVGFKSIICYRRGLDIPPEIQIKTEDAKIALRGIISGGLRDAYGDGFSLVKRLEHSPLNDLVVHTAAKLIRDASGHKKPLQFHTGLGDNDITLTKSSPSHLQNFIREYPTVPIVLLHAGYPWTKETAYLATMYPNVYADIGEVFPCVSRQGQEAVVKEMLEVCPWTKILCSTDGHGFPEMYMIAVNQIRSVLESILGALVRNDQIDEKQAVQIVQAVLFSNSKKLYNLQTVSILPNLAQLETVSRTKQTSNQSIVQRLQSLKAKYLRIYWHDYTSTSKCRTLPIRQVYKTLSSGKPVTLSITKAGLGLLQTDAMIPQVNASGAFTVQVDWSSLKPGPAAGHVSVYGDFTEQDGTPASVCPRTTLRTTLSKAGELGLTFLLGFEVEFVVLDRVQPADFNGMDKYDTRRSNGHSWSTARVLSDWGREGSFNTASEEMMDALDAAGISFEQFHPESAPGQYELVLAPLPPLEACDSLLHARQILESVAARHDFRITLHPKPFSTACGSGSHVHMSISSPGGDRPAVYEPFYAGILGHFRAITAFVNPSPASYERMIDSYWAGGRWITWGTQNKEAPLRKVEGSHWELKVMDGMANPYLAIAALLSAGTHGFRRKSPLTWGDCLGDPAKMDEREKRKLGITTLFPGNLREALDALKQDGLGLNPDVVTRYINIKHAELEMLEKMKPDRRRMWLMERY